jgi:hypothetical protein
MSFDLSYQHQRSPEECEFFARHMDCYTGIHEPLIDKILDNRIKKKLNREQIWQWLQFNHVITAD